jgi:hypothetical protein
VADWLTTRASETIHKELGLDNSDARGEVEREIEAVLDAYEKLRKSGVDQWRTKKSRRQTAKQLESFAATLESAEKAIGELGTHARSALEGWTSPDSPLSALIPGDGSGTGFALYRKRFAELIGELDPTRALLGILLKEHDSARMRWENEDAEERSKPYPTGATPLLPYERISRELQVRAELARMKAKELRALELSPGRPAKISDFYVTAELMRIWEKRTGRSVSLGHPGQDDKPGPFGRFARECAQLVNPNYSGVTSVEEILKMRIAR